MTAALPPDAVRAMLAAAAREGRAVTYAQVLNRLGHPFSRPLMRQLCRVLDRIDADAAAAAEPPLAVLVVRQADGLPGQGWWIARGGREAEYLGAWDGAEARAFVAARQELAFRYWQNRAA